MQATVFQHNHLMVLLVLLLALSGCASVEPIAKPDLTRWPQEFGAETTSTISNDWWLDFSDEALNKWVQSGLNNNYSLQATWAQLAQSEAVWRRNKSELYPDLSLSISGSREWRERTSTDLWQAGISTSYEVDLWGRVRALSEQGRLTAQASLAATRVQANTVAANVALNWFGLRTQETQLQLIESQQKRMNDSLRVIKARFHKGVAQISDVWQQEQVIETLIGEEINTRAERDRYRQQLALWVANPELLKTDATFTVASNLPILVDVPAVPLEALQSRPDVERAWFTLQAANAGVAAAVSDRYPRLTLTGSVGGKDNDVSQVFNNWLANLAGSLVLPLVDGGNRRAQVAQQRAVVEEALANYQQALLVAVQEVQTALTGEAQMRKSIESLERQLTLARSTESFQNNSYRKGSGDFLNLLTAERAVLHLEQQLLAARWTQLQYRIQLYRAVSHGDFNYKEERDDV